MVGFGETYLAAFVLALGQGELAAGLVSGIPMLAGAILQLVSPAAIRRLGSHRTWIVMCAFVQAASFGPLVYAAIVQTMPLPLVFLVASVYWASGMATGPAWNTWAGTLVPRPIRARYFARRSRVAHFAVLVGVAGGGMTLQVGASHGKPLTAFAILFLIAGVCRFISMGLLASQSEPQPPDDEHRVVPMREMLSRVRHGHDGRLLVFLLAMQTAVQISGPYFTPFMLGQMKMSYATYLLLIATSYSARIAVLPMLGGLVRRVGPMRVLQWAGTGIIPLSALWIISDSIWYLLAVQLLAGAIWAAYELASFLMLFEAIREEERTSVLTTFNLANAIATVGGSLLGGVLLASLGTNREAYFVLFGISGFARICTIPLMRMAMRGHRTPTLPAEIVDVPTRVVAVRPNLGAIEGPILPGLPEVDADKPLKTSAGS
jgi:MFS family permease